MLTLVPLLLAAVLVARTLASFPCPDGQVQDTYGMCQDCAGGDGCAVPRVGDCTFGINVAALCVHVRQGSTIKETDGTVFRVPRRATVLLVSVAALLWGCLVCLSSLWSLWPGSCAGALTCTPCPAGW
jgi:hypothetical protein